MAQFDFYGSWEDTLAILNALIALKKYSFLIDERYELEAPPFWFDHLDDISLKELEGWHYVLLWSRDYSMFPPYFHIYPAIPQVKNVSIEKSGPALELTLVKNGTLKGQAIVGYGWLMHPSCFYYPDTGEPYKTPEALKQAYREVRRIIMSCCERRYLPAFQVTPRGFKSYVKTYWIGKRGLAALEAGEIFLCLPQDELVGPDKLYKKRQDVLTILAEDDEWRWDEGWWEAD